MALVGPAVTSLSPFSLKELESQVRCLEKEATELQEAVEQQKAKNNVSAEGMGVRPGLWESHPRTGHSYPFMSHRHGQLG